KKKKKIKQTQRYKYLDQKEFVIGSKNGYEIVDLKIYKNQFVICRTPQTLLLADMGLGSTAIEKIAEAENKTADEKPSKSNSTSVGNEKNLATEDSTKFAYSEIEWQHNTYTTNNTASKKKSNVRTEFINPHSLSFRNYKKKDTCVIAYLLDLQTIQVLDIKQQLVWCTINHNQPIQWLELNDSCSHLLFLDDHRSLYLFPIHRTSTSPHDNSANSHGCTLLLNLAKYAQWVPNSSVIVAQNRNNDIYVWYYLCDLNNVFLLQSICGDVVDIERHFDIGQTRVIVLDPGPNKNVYYTLNEIVIRFQTAIEQKDFQEAVNTLSAMRVNCNESQKDELNSLWRQLSEMALQLNDYYVAQRCLIELGDISKAQFLQQQILKSQDKNLEQAYMLILNKQYKRAENIFLQKGDVNRTVEMYLSLNKWKDGIHLAKIKNHPLLEKIKEKQIHYLLSNQQYSEASKTKQSEGDVFGAIKLCIEGGWYNGCADLVVSNRLTIDQLTKRDVLLDDIVHYLSGSHSYLKCGELLEYFKENARALEMYKEGKCFSRALQLCKKFDKSLCSEMELEWANYLEWQVNDFEQAIHHYLESNHAVEAVQCSLHAHKYQKACQLLDQLSSASASNNEKANISLKSLYKQVADYYATVNDNVNLYTATKTAEKYYIKGGFVKECILMFLQKDAFEEAKRIATLQFASSFFLKIPWNSTADLVCVQKKQLKSNLTTEMQTVYAEEIERLENENKLEEAVKLLLCCKDLNRAIELLIKHSQYTKVLEMVQEFEPSRLVEVQLTIAKLLRAQNEFKQAEYHYIRANVTLEMYKENKLWEDAMRVGKTQGGLNIYKQLAYEYACSLQNHNLAVEMLIEKSLVDKAIDYTLEVEVNFEKAFQIAAKQCPHKANEIHHKYALHLQKLNEFSKAEEEFVAANQPHQIVEMYLNHQMWDEAIRSAQIYAPDILDQIYKARGLTALEEGNIVECERWLILAEDFEILIKIYEERGENAEAIRIANKYLPETVEKNFHIGKEQGTQSLEELLKQAQLLKDSGNYEDAVQTLLKISTSHHKDIEYIIGLWEEGLNLSMEKALSNLPETIAVIAQRLYDLGKFKQSAVYWLEINQHLRAIQCYIKCNEYKKAQQVAETYAPEHSAMIASEYEKHLIEKGELNQLSQVNLKMAQNIYASKQEWDKLYAIAAQSDDKDNVAKQAFVHAKSFFNDEKMQDIIESCKSAVQVLTR
ncbi:hypothetical protein RFI_27118, partial [Reticulomyxa filosa]